MVVKLREYEYYCVMKRYANPRGTVLFTLIAVILMLIIHLMMNVWAVKKDGAQVAEPARFKTSLHYPDPSLESGAALELGADEFEDIVAAYAASKIYGPSAPDIPVDEGFVEEIYTDAPQPKIEKAQPDYQPLVVTGRPKIAIIIDDMGVNRENSFKVIDLDAPLTLAFLPYAPDLPGITGQAQAKGHELMIHMPMQAMSDPVSLGPIAIRADMDEVTVKENMRAAFESFEGYVGLNNHMGSKVTQNLALMDWVMESVSERGLYFIDSKTIGASVAADVSRQNGLPTAVRDVFLDHEETPEFVGGALRKTEEIAAKKGYAIAIGHPKDVTIEGLRAWLPDVQARGFEIVHAGRLVERPKGQERVAVSTDAQDKVALRLLSKVEPAAGEDVFKKKSVIEKPDQKAVVKEAAVEIAPEEEGVKKQAVLDDDPNSAQAREAILKKMLGQAP